VADFFQSISQFLNLNKLTAVTIPGMIAALALSLFIFPPPCTLDTNGKCWACQGEQKKAPPPFTATFTVERTSRGEEKKAPGAGAITPDNGKPGQDVAVVIMGGASTKWDSSSKVSVEPEGVKVTDKRVEGDAQITAKFQIDPSASIGPRTVAVTNASSNGSDTSTGGKTPSDAGNITVSCATWGWELGRSASLCSMLGAAPPAPPTAEIQSPAPKKGGNPGAKADASTATRNEGMRYLSPSDVDACNDVPVYVVKNSRVKSQDKPDSGDASSSKSKTPKGYPGETLIDPANVLKALDSCTVGLQKASATRDDDNSTLQTKITGIGAQLTSLLAAQEKAKEAQNQLLARSYQPDIDSLKKEIAGLQKQSQGFLSAKQIIGVVLAQVAALRADVTGQVNSKAPPEAPPAKNTFQSVLQGVSNNLLVFLAASLVIGMILDPVQRMVMSWAPGRATRFHALNRARSHATGEIRFGDRRYGTPDHLRREDPDVYEPNYAVGRGLLTQSEYNALYDQYYRQSELATGLILPLLMLAATGCIRIDCCYALGGWMIWLLALVGILIWFILAWSLWRVGLDRLHKFYSEVQARIAGRAKKLESVQEDKILALLGDPKYQEQIQKEYTRLGEILEKISKPKRDS